MKVCENCENEHDGLYASGRFCSVKCSRGYSTKNKREEINKKVSKALTGTKLTNETKTKIGKDKKDKKLTEQHKKNIAIGVKKNSETRVGNVRAANSILDLSKRTVTKVLERMNVGCSNCGWNKSTCDIHHINGRKINDADNHMNLCLLCPNCHRLVHTGKLDSNKLINLVDYIGDQWKEHYYW